MFEREIRKIFDSIPTLSEDFESQAKELIATAKKNGYDELAEEIQSDMEFILYYK